MSSSPVPRSTTYGPGSTTHGLRSTAHGLRVLQATPLTFGRLTLWSFLALLVTTTLADADLWGHLRFGLDILASKSLHTSDPYSFTSDRPWVNHEWLSELLTALAYRTFGTFGLGLLKLSMLAIVFAVLFGTARRLQAPPIARDLFVALALFVTYSRTQVIRPQLFSVALFFTILWLLTQADRGRLKALFGVPVCFAIWANLHGAWIVGLGALGLWLLGDAYQHKDRRRALILGAVGLASVLATLVNPYGIGLWQFVAETVRPARPDITDWKPLLQLPLPIIAIECLLPLLVTIAVVRVRPRQIPLLRDLAVVALLGAAMFRVGRVDAFFQAALAVLMARPLLTWFGRLDLNIRPSLQRASLPVGVLTLALGVYTAVNAAGNLRVIRVEGKWIPDQTAALLLRDARPGARVLTWFDWGEYALWHLSPAGIRVSMDGRRETVYSDRVNEDHQRFYAGDPKMLDYPDRIGADHIWLPTRLKVADALIANGWIKVLDTGQSVVLARSGPPIPMRAIPITSNNFPWP
jgi:hypothetical protein